MTSTDSRLRPQDSIDPDRHHRAGDNRDGVEIGRLIEGIEGREEEQTGEAAADGARGDFREHQTAAPATAVPICKVTLAVGTGRHSV